MVRIAVFDDDNQTRNDIALILKSDIVFNIVGMFKSGQNLIKDLKDVKPDVVLMDIDMPKFDGIETIRIIKETYPNIQVLIQTSVQDEQSVYQSIFAGASGYILKNQLQFSLVSSLNELCAGGAPLSPTVARQVVLSFQNDGKRYNKPSKDYGLTHREKDVLSCLILGLSYKMIGDKLNISYETVRSHMKNIYTKLKVESLTAIVAKTINQNLLNS